MILQNQKLNLDNIFWTPFPKLCNIRIHKNENENSSLCHNRFVKTLLEQVIQNIFFKKTLQNGSRLIIVS